MKVITKCVIDIETLLVVEEISYEYSGPVALCKGGSGGGGGGGSGAIDYPDYMEDIHFDWLNNSGADAITSSITDVMNSAIGSSPWAAQSAYDPDTDIADYVAELTAFGAILAGLNDTVDWAALYTQAETSVDPTGITEAGIVADVDAFADQIDDEIVSKVLPRFRRGMQDINAVVSSAFPIGESIIEGFRDREVAKHNSAIRLAAMNVEVQVEQLRLNASAQMMDLLLHRIDWHDGYMRAYIEAMRIKIVAKKEENEVDMKIDEADGLWDLEAFQYGANLLAGIGGGTMQPGGKEPSPMQSMLGGALSGAAAGAMIGAQTGMIGGPAGAGIGALLGAASSFL